MKILTLWQPWASLMAMGLKTIETFSWDTKYRGPVAIHADLTMPTKAVRLCQSEPFRSALAVGGIRGAHDLPRGSVLAIVELVECITIVSTLPIDYRRGGQAYVLPPKSPEREFGLYGPGRVAWITRNARRFREPLPLSLAYRPGLRDWDPDPGIIEQLTEGKDNA